MKGIGILRDTRKFEGPKPPGPKATINHWLIFPSFISDFWFKFGTFQGFKWTTCRYGVGNCNRPRESTVNLLVNHPKTLKDPLKP